ncbi:hypothetical protein PhCBS80983_g00274 [Powellomyces hirtus]|uniref:ATP-dependent DNA helicase II subunit 2 n=1 Tax=Powellomyces hirtus TaxID=109895 RepID=A0A507EH67_9FUNG|nr:hypothetical protein PhCBS80983_g00274 [Powellomyces hirtus]
MATVLILDVNPSMRKQSQGHDKTAQQRAQEAIFQILHSKIITGRKTDCVALLLVGTEASDNILAEGDQYQHVKAYHFEEDEDALLRPADLSLLKYVEQGCEEGSGGGDVMDAIIIAVHMIEQFCRHLKYEKKVTIFTDAENFIETDGSEAVLAKAKEMGIFLNLIGYEFDNPDVGIKYEDKPKQKAENEKFLRDFAGGLESNVWDGDEAASFLGSLRSKEVRPTPVFTGPLLLGDTDAHPDESLNITVRAYNKTTEMKLPSAKKWSTRAEEVPGEERTGELYGKVDMERAYKVVAGADDTDLGLGSTDASSSDKEEFLPKDELVRAYRYGKTLVPFSDEDEEAMRLKTVKGISILGFVKRDHVQRHHFMSNVLAVFADPVNPVAERLFPPLMAGLRRLKWVALARYVRTDNSNPKLGFLIPHQSQNELAQKESALWVQIPFFEDIREHVFKSLDFLVDATVLNGTQLQSLSSTNGTQSALGSQASSSKKHKLDVRQASAQDVKERLDAFIDVMDLSGSAQEDGEEAFKPKNVYNPSWQRLYECIAHRAIHPDGELPPINPMIVACINPLPQMMEKALPAAQKLQECFLIRKVEKKVSGKRAWAERAALVGDPLNPDEFSHLENGTPSEKRAKIEDAVPVATSMEALTGRLVEKVSTINPVDDFNTMINRTDKDCVSSAVQQMCTVITDLVTNSFQHQLYDKAFNCLVALRNACVIQEEPVAFNKWLSELKRDLTIGDHPEHTPFWERVRESQITLIPHDEEGETSVTAQDAEEFLAKPEDGQQPAAAAEDVAEEEDLLGMMD